MPEQAVDPPPLATAFEPALPRRLARRQAEPCCPFIDAGDHRCAASFTLHGIDRAFDYCLRRPLACSTFYRLAAERHVPVAAAFGGFAGGDPAAAAPAGPSQGAAFVALTRLGQPLDAAGLARPAVRAA